MRCITNQRILFSKCYSIICVYSLIRDKRFDSLPKFNIPRIIFSWTLFIKISLPINNGVLCRRRIDKGHLKISKLVPNLKKKNIKPPYIRWTSEIEHFYGSFPFMNFWNFPLKIKLMSKSTCKGILKAQKLKIQIDIFF